MCPVDCIVTYLVMRLEHNMAEVTEYLLLRFVQVLLVVLTIGAVIEVFKY